MAKRRNKIKQYKIRLANAESGLPLLPIHPGELLKEELEFRRISQRSFAEKLGLPYTALNEILNGKRPVTTDFALLMEAALDVDPGLLLRMQTSYNLQAAQKNDKLNKRLAEVRKEADMF